MSFEKLDLSDKILSALKDISFTTMTPIQEKAIPEILKGKDIVGQAQTGTGKTAAFAIPSLERLDFQNNSIQVLVIAPTRELAFQISEEFKKIGKNISFTSVVVCGGMSQQKQIEKIRRKPKIVVATPGRLVQFLEEKKIDISGIKIFIIDEIDEMIKAGFKKELREITSYLPKKKQSLLFSATMNKDVFFFTEKLLNDPIKISVGDKKTPNDSVVQFYVLVNEGEKYEILTNLLEMGRSSCVSSIVFGRTKKRVEELSIALNQNGYSAVGLHGNMSQAERLIALQNFRKGHTNILVATDVAARGLDIPNIRCVYNFDLPQDIEFYIHRIGRTGRAHQSGSSVTLVRKEELPYIEKIKNQTKSTILVMVPPSVEDIWGEKKLSIKSRIEKFDFENAPALILELATELIKKYPKELLVSSLIDQVQKKKRKVLLSGEPSVVVKKNKRSFRKKRYSSRSYSRKKYYK